MKKAVYLCSVDTDSYYYSPDDNTVYLSSFNGSKSATLGFCMLCTVVIEILSAKLKNINELNVLRIVFLGSNILWLVGLLWQKKSIYRTMRPIYPLHADLVQKVDLMESNYRYNNIAVIIFLVMLLVSVYVWVNSHTYIWLWTELACVCFLYFEVFVNGQFHKKEVIEKIKRGEIP